MLHCLQWEAHFYLVLLWVQSVLIEMLLNFRFVSIKNDIHLYKNLLQEYALREGLFMPQYKTTKAGEAHDPTFNATVEVEGETFHGNPAMSKKQAELSAAKVAYTNLMQSKL